MPVNSQLLDKMGQKNVSQGDGYGGDTNNTERAAEGSGETVQRALEEVSTEQAGEDAESLEEMGVSERYRESINDIPFSSEMDDEDVAKVERSLGKLASPGEEGMTVSQYDRFRMDELESEGLATDVMARTWGRADGTPRAGTEQRIGVQEGITDMQADVGAVHAFTVANGMDTESHAAGERSRRQVEEGNIGDLVDSTGQERASRALVTQNSSMSTEWAEEFRDKSNDLYGHYVETAEETDGEWRAEHQFDAARDDSLRAVANGREAAVLVATSLMKDDQTMGTNAFVHHGDVLKAGVDAVGDRAVGQDQKKLLNYMHDRSQMMDDVESPWDGTPFEDVEYDYAEVARQTISNRFAGAGVDNRFFPGSDPEDMPELPDENSEVNS